MGSMMGLGDEPEIPAVALTVATVLRSDADHYIVRSD